MFLLVIILFICCFKGPACSPAANPIARDVGPKNIHIVSYSATSAELSNNATFQNFYRVAASDLVLVQGRVNFVKSQGWYRVGRNYCA